MKNKGNEIKRICGFYINNCHLTTMMLPYIHKEIENENKIITILQNGIKNNIQEILSKMNLNQNLYNKILEINWNRTNTIKYSEIKNKLENIKGEEYNNINILINGDIEFINRVNQNIEKVLKNINIKGVVSIINYYEIMGTGNIEAITNKHEYIINTSGIKSIKNNNLSKEA
jgi:hypothetical protein